MKKLHNCYNLVGFSLFEKRFANAFETQPKTVDTFQVSANKLDSPEARDKFYAQARIDMAKLPKDSPETRDLENLLKQAQDQKGKEGEKALIATLDTRLKSILASKDLGSQNKKEAQPAANSAPVRIEGTPPAVAKNDGQGIKFDHSLDQGIYNILTIGSHDPKKGGPEALAPKEKPENRAFDKPAGPKLSLTEKVVEGAKTVLDKSPTDR